jgi:multicomponent Na+:H+ antiporter subunit B
MDAVVDILILALLGVSGIAILRLRNLVAVVMLSGIYSLLCALLYTTLDAVDVAFTEAAVGAGISTVLMLGTLALVGKEEKKPTHRPLLPLFIVFVVGGALIYGTSDLPPFGAPDNPANLHVAPRYIEESGHEVGMPNIVTSVLASYRGYDTMGETTVIFTALVGVLLLLATGPRNRPLWDPDARVSGPDDHTPGDAPGYAGPGDARDGSTPGDARVGSTGGDGPEDSTRGDVHG